MNERLLSPGRLGGAHGGVIEHALQLLDVEPNDLLPLAIKRKKPKKGDGKKNSDRSSYTDTYVKRNGRWQVVASHLGPVPKK